MQTGAGWRSAELCNAPVALDLQRRSNAAAESQASRINSETTSAGIAENIGVELISSNSVKGALTGINIILNDFDDGHLMEGAVSQSKRRRLFFERFSRQG